MVQGSPPMEERDDGESDDDDGEDDDGEDDGDDDPDHDDDRNDRVKTFCGGGRRRRP